MRTGRGVRWLAAGLACGVILMASSCSDDDASDSAPTTTVAGSSTTGPPATAADGPAVATHLLDPVGPGTDVELAAAVTVRLVSSDDIEATAAGPGETAGPAVAVTLEVRNGSDAPVDLAQLSVSATHGDDVPADENTASPAAPFTGEVAVGGRSTGTYVFRVPDGEADTLVVSVAAGFAADVPRFHR